MHSMDTATELRDVAGANFVIAGDRENTTRTARRGRRPVGRPAWPIRRVDQDTVKRYVSTTGAAPQRSEVGDTS